MLHSSAFNFRQSVCTEQEEHIMLSFYKYMIVAFQYTGRRLIKKSINLRERYIWQLKVYTLLVSTGSELPEASLVIWGLEHVEIAINVLLATFSWKDDCVMLRGFVDKKHFYFKSLILRKKESQWKIVGLFSRTLERLVQGLIFSIWIK